LTSASDLLAKHLKNHSDALTGQLGALVSAVEAVKDSNERYFTGVDSLLRQSEFIEKNQKMLETAVQTYETSMQDMTRQLGDGLGAYIKMHAQAASQMVNGTLAAHVDTVLQSNRETLQRIHALFDQLRDQSKEISASLLILHEKGGAAS